MSVADEVQFEELFVSRTRSYLAGLEDCVASLPELLDAYETDGAYRAYADRIGGLETDCDRTHREVSSLLADAGVDEMGLELTRLHLHAGQVLELYRRLDGIANGAEQFAEELVAIEPDRVDAAFDPLVELADAAVETMSVLRETIVEYVEALCDPERSITLGRRIDRIRELEGRCDQFRTECISAAFETDLAQPLVYRHLAVLLDEVVDAMEDVTDQLIFVTGNVPWIDVGTADPRT